MRNGFHSNCYQLENAGAAFFTLLSEGGYTFFAHACIIVPESSHTVVKLFQVIVVEEMAGLEHSNRHGFETTQKQIDDSHGMELMKFASIVKPAFGK